MTESIPPVAIILTIVFVWFCLIGLLFLLMKQKRYTGFVTITVTGVGLYHSVQFPSAQHTGAWAADMVRQGARHRRVRPAVRHVRGPGAFSPCRRACRGWSRRRCRDTWSPSGLEVEDHDGEGESSANSTADGSPLTVR